MSIFLGCVFYLTLFIAWRQLQPDLIVFYQGLATAALVAFAQGLLQKMTRRGTPAKDALMTFLLCYSFMFTIPTTVDRAYSVRMLAELGSAPDGMTREQLEHWFAKEFAAQGGIEKRLLEQQTTGSVVEQQGRFHLTSLGRTLLGAFDVAHQVFNTRAPAQ